MIHHHHLDLTLLDTPLAICRLAPDAAFPAWAMEGPFWSVTRTTDETSVICAMDAVPDHISAEGPWRAFKVAGPLDLALTGILSSLAQPLAKAGISIFALSTFDTDYLLVKAERLEAAVNTLRDAGHRVPDLH
ncbi:MAG TPA: ACT domain-containing protein [Holophagaceae bacterium]|nr:ACT domain-containing protein [Holophagaceae bacterium]